MTHGQSTELELSSFGRIRHRFRSIDWVLFSFCASARNIGQVCQAHPSGGLQTAEDGIIVVYTRIEQVQQYRLNLTYTRSEQAQNRHRFPFTCHLPRHILILILPSDSLHHTVWHLAVIRLSSVPTVYISKEILQRGDQGRFSAAEIEAQLIQALTAPTGKMSSKNRFFADGRFVEDYLMHKTLKPFRTLDVVGFSVNPEHCRGETGRVWESMRECGSASERERERNLLRWLLIASYWLRISPTHESRPFCALVVHPLSATRLSCLWTSNISHCSHTLHTDNHPLTPHPTHITLSHPHPHTPPTPHTPHSHTASPPQVSIGSTY